MAMDPTKPLLRLNVGEQERRNPGHGGGSPKPAKFSRAGQRAAFGPSWTRLERVLNSDPTALELRRDPSALAPERLLVFELRGSVQSFAKAIRRVPGLEFIDEEEIKGDDPDETPIVYLLIPDLAALRQMLSMWKDWLRGTKPKHGLTAFRDVFDTLKHLRPWGPQDRILEEDRKDIATQLDQTGAIRVEVELVFRFSNGIAQIAEETISTFVVAVGGRVISRSRITDIAYHALLVELPAEAAQGLLDRTASSIAGLDPIMHIRPQSLATTIDVAEREETATIELPEQRRRDPILALLDGVPVSQHPLLAGTLSVEDLFSLEPGTPVGDRHHGTAMASLIVHGDRNVPQAVLGRRVHLRPPFGRTGSVSRG
jgi:hypothetical protein